MSESGHDRSTVGIVIVDHGSRRDESNRLLLEVVEQFARATGSRIVEPAHMELAEPSIRRTSLPLESRMLATSSTVLPAADHASFLSAGGRPASG